ncbi:MAG: DUF2207 family protein, partial [Mycetocola sp.]
TRYVVSYRLENVAFNPDPQTQTEDEFYWDLLGGAMAQSINRATASVTVPPELADQLDGRSRCFVGEYGATTSCDLARSVTAEGTRFDLGPLEAQPDTAWSLVLGFNEGTFVRPHFPEETPLGRFGWIGFVGAGVAGAVVMFLVRRRWRDAPGRGTVIAQYSPDPAVSPRLAAEIISVSDSTVLTAEILALATGGFIRIIQPEGKKKLWLELIQPSVPGDGASERSLDRTLGALFPTREPGTINKMKSSAQKQAKRLEALDESANAVSAGYRALPVNRGPRRWILILTGLLAACGAAVGVYAVITQAFTPQLLLGGLFLGAVIVLGLILQSPPRLLTRQGAEAKEHLEGLKLFINLAEKDRIRVLQSVDGVQRVEVTDGAQMLRVTEKLLPWAALFGQEKSWAAELAVRYEQVGQPGWYVSDGAFNAVVLSSMLSTMSRQSAVTLAAASSGSGGGVSGGSGFSGGGGFAGGGGGGGFSGGR